MLPSQLSHKPLSKLGPTARATEVSTRSWWLDLLWLSIILGSLLFILLGTRPLFTPDEGRYAEIIREMVASHDYVTPYLNGIKYFEKPVLFYWLGVAAVKIAGLHLWSLRSVNAVLGLLGCLLTYATARQLYDRQTGWLAALILGSSLLYFVMAHTISLDLTVTFFLTACFYFFLLGLQQPPGIKRRGYVCAAAIAAALAVLTKGLIGLVFPAMIIGIWLLITGRWRSLKQFYLPSCLLVFLLIAVPWHVVVSMRNPEFAYFYFIEQHFLRYTTMDVGHYQPTWFFIPCLIMGFFPWIVFLPQAIFFNVRHAWYQREKAATDIFFLLWSLLIFLFFSFSKSKLIPYILPIFPPLAILTANYLKSILHQKITTGIKISYGILLLLSLAIAYALYQFTHYTLLPDAFHAKRYLQSAALILVSGILISCVGAYYQIKIALRVTFVTSYLFLLIALASIPSIETRTILPLAHVLKPILTSQDNIITFNQYYQDLPFYLQRRVSVLNWRNELTYGMQHQDTHDWMINDDIFWQLFHSQKRIFVIISNEQFNQLLQKYPNEKFHILGKTVNNTLMSNVSI